MTTVITVMSPSSVPDRSTELAPPHQAASACRALQLSSTIASLFSQWPQAAYHCTLLCFHPQLWLIIVVRVERKEERQHHWKQNRKYWKLSANSAKTSRLIHIGIREAQDKGDKSSIWTVGGTARAWVWMLPSPQVNSDCSAHQRCWPSCGVQLCYLHRVDAHLFTWVSIICKEHPKMQFSLLPCHPFLPPCLPLTTDLLSTMAGISLCGRSELFPSMVAFCWSQPWPPLFPELVLDLPCMFIPCPVSHTLHTAILAVYHHSIDLKWNISNWGGLKGFSTPLPLFFGPFLAITWLLPVPSSTCCSAFGLHRALL